MFNLAELQIIRFVSAVFIVNVILLGLIFLIFFVFIDNAYAIENKVLEYELFPKKIHEGDIVILEMYKTMQGKILLEKDINLKIESLDRDIVEVIDLDYNHDYKTLVKIKANKEGKTTLYVFTEGSKALEIPITIYGNNLPKNISLDIFPNTIDEIENNQGILFLSLTDENGIPTKADKDYLIKLSTSKSGMVKFEESNTIISKGEVGVKQRFSGIKAGEVTITAKTDELESSEILTIDKKPEKSIEISVIPNKISSTKNNSAYLIAQLYSGGELIKAAEDITVYFKISSDTEVANTSLEESSLNPTGYFQIKKGQTYGYTTFSIQKGITDTYTITATSQNPLVTVEESFSTVDVELYGEKEIKFSPLSVLSDGNKQLVGVMYLQDENGHPVIANKDIVVPFTASDDSISIETVVIKKGFDSALVFGNFGYFVPPNQSIAPNIHDAELVDIDIQGAGKESTDIKSYLPTNTILKGEEQWIIVYMESSNGLFKIPKSQGVEISESKILKIDKDRIEIFPYFVLIPVIATDTGDEELIVSSGEFETTVTISSISSKVDSLDLDHSKKLFKDINDEFIVQIINSQGLPVQTNDEIKVKIFSSDPSIIDFPKEITIPKKTSFVRFDVIPENAGVTEVSLVSEGLPIVTKDITVEDTTLTIQITSNDTINEGESFIVSILATQNNNPLQNAAVTWDFDGGFSTIYDERTGPTGEAVASIIATSDESVKISVIIDNGPKQSASMSKVIKVNTASQINTEVESPESFKKPDMGGFDPVLVLVPGVIGGVIFYMKKKSK